MAIQDPLTGLIIGCCFKVANELGPGFLEKVYENALAFEFRDATCLLVNFGRANIQVRRLSLNRRPEDGDVDLKVDEVQ